jgi:hypothetical protein
MTTETLKQGLSFKKYQNKIIKKANIERNIESFQNIKNDTQKLIDVNPAIQQTAINELETLQTQYKSVLERYQTAQAQLMTKTTNYLNISKKGAMKNVVVDHVVDSPSSTYVGLYNDNSVEPAMSSVDSELTYDQCQNNAIMTGYKYFGLENNQCSVSNDMEQVAKYGEAIPNCSIKEDGKLYGNDKSFALYSTSNSYGCYKNGDPISMSPSGPDLSSYTLVNYLCKYGSGPWGSNGTFPDPTAFWMWYTSTALTDAPINTGSPITLICNYYYSGDTYIKATINCLCDNNATIYLNAQQIGSADNYSDNVQIPITIAPGNNYISAAVINTGGPAGFILSCVDSNGTILFNSGSYVNWYYTPILATQLVPSGANYSYETCKQYAQNSGFQYFGLKNGGVGSSECMVSNDFQKSIKYGVDTQSITSPEGKVFGVGSVNAVYTVNTPGNPENMGKIGYINADESVSEYPSDMIKDGSIIDPNPTCSTNTDSIDSIQWQNYVKTANMTKDTKCGLAMKIQRDTASVEELESELENVSRQIVEKINSLEKLDSDVQEQLGINKIGLQQMITEYTNVTKNFTSNDNNINNIVSDSNIVMTAENYNYIFWFIMALLSIFIVGFLIIKFVKNQQPIE